MGERVLRWGADARCRQLTDGPSDTLALLFVSVRLTRGQEPEGRAPMVTAPEQLDVTRREQRDEALHHLVKDSVERLSTQLSDGHTWEFLSLLRFYSRFWTYSVRNCLLIKLQCPDATRCAGRTLWNKQGYTIRKGQKAIWIWAPITRRETDPETGELLTLIAGFVPAPVFDFSQLKECDEKPLPMIVPTQPDDMAAEFRRLVNKIQAHGVDVTLQPLSTTHLGRSRPGTIVVSNRLDSRNQIFVMLHELTHQLWHHDGAEDPDRDLPQVTVRIVRSVVVPELMRQLVQRDVHPMCLDLVHQAAKLGRHVVRLGRHDHGQGLLIALLELREVKDRSWDKAGNQDQKFAGFWVRLPSGDRCPDPDRLLPFANGVALLVPQCASSTPGRVRTLQLDQQAIAHRVGPESRVEAQE